MATKTVGLMIMPGPDIDANLKAKNMPGAAPFTKDYVEVPDWSTRHKYLETALKLKGHFDPKKREEASESEEYMGRISKMSQFCKDAGLPDRI